jgi:nucleoside-diphosphate-sugar epimerase
MRVLVFGGSGALGLPSIRALTAAGHAVVAVSRSARRAATVVRAGADAVVADLLDATAVDRTVADVRPEVVVHAATALPAGGPQRWSQLELTNVLRDRGSQLLAQAAARHQVRRLVNQSFLGGYQPIAAPDRRLSERAAFGPTGGSRGLRRAAGALAAIEQHTRQGPFEGVVLRFGFFYGDKPGTDALHAALISRRLPLPGGAPGVVSFIHVDDAAAAVVAAVQRAPAGAVYNVADAAPCRFGEYVCAVAAAIDAPRPRTVPTIVARVVAPAAVEFVTKHRPLDATHLCTQTGWSPAHRNVLEQVMRTR